jgi:RHS repeat-associated protein
MSVYKLGIDTVLSSLSYAQKERHIYGSSMLGMDTDSLELISPVVGDTTLYSYLVGNKRYQMSNHLGNVLAVISDKKLPVPVSGLVSYYLPEIVSTSDYSPFGVELEGRNFNSEKFRFGFNGMEKDDEVKGKGNSYTTEFREYDPRLGRWLSLDPLMVKYPFQSPYVAFNNNPILFKDPSGLEGENGNEPPKRENILKAPEESANSLTNAYQIEPNNAVKAFKKDKEDPTYGYIKSGEGYAKVFFDSEFDDRGTKGAYFAQKPVKEEVGLVTQPQFPIEIAKDVNNNITSGTFNQVASFIQNSSETLMNSKEPIKDLKQGITVTIHYAGYGTDVAIQRSDAETIQRYVAANFRNINVYVSTNPTSGTSGVQPTGTSTIQISLTTKKNVYGF